MIVEYLKEEDGSTDQEDGLPFTLLIVLYSDQLDHHGTRATSTVANTCSPDLSTLSLQDIDEGDDDSASRVSEWVSHGNGSTMNVNLFRIQA